MTTTSPEKEGEVATANKKEVKDCASPIEIPNATTTAGQVCSSPPRIAFDHCAWLRIQFDSIWSIWFLLFPVDKSFKPKWNCLQKSFDYHGEAEVCCRWGQRLVIKIIRHLKIGLELLSSSSQKIIILLNFQVQLPLLPWPWRLKPNFKTAVDKVMYNLKARSFLAYLFPLNIPIAFK